MSVLREVKVIFADEIVQSLKTKKALLTVISYLILMFIGLKIGSYFEIFVWLYAEMRKSFSVLLPYYVSVIIIPLFCIITGYNVVSSEISTGSIRFIAYRARRFSILLGKLLSTAVIAVVMILLAYAIATYYLYQKTGLFYYTQSLIAWAYLSIYAVCFICLINLVSMLAKKVAIVWNLFVCIFFVFLLNYDYIKYLSPFYYSNNALAYIIDGDLSKMLLGMLILALFGLIFFSASWLLIEKSDL